MEKIKCLLCNRKFKRITNTHLNNKHNTTIKQYKKMFPDALIETQALAIRRVQRNKGKTYAEIYGKQKAKKLKKIRSEATLQDWNTNPIRLQIKKISEEKRKEEKSKIKFIGRPRQPDNFGNSICKNCGKEFTYRKSDSTGKFCCHVCYIEYSKRNANGYRIKAFSNLPHICDECGVPESKSKLLVHHKDSNRYHNELENLQILCPVCHQTKHKRGAAIRGKFSTPAIQAGFREIMSGLKIDIKDSNFFETPQRVAKMYKEVLEGILPSAKEEIKNQLSKTFPCDNNNMIIIQNIVCWSMCPHHFLPVKYKINIGYIPNKKVLGLSKIPRLAILLAKRPILQEQLSHDIVEIFNKYTKPLGVIVNITGEHLCMQMRGVKAVNSKAITTSATGLLLKNDAGCKDEFINRIGSTL